MMRKAGVHMDFTTLISGDWGSSTFRLRWVERAGARVRGEICTDEGAAAVAPETAPGSDARADAFRALLAARLRELRARVGLPLDGAVVAISGMAGSSIGWRELPYAPLPVGLDGAGLICREIDRLEPGLPVLLVSGLTTGQDVLRGEETEILGVLAAPELARFRGEAVLLLPGTHAKHVYLHGGRIVSFATYMTGELFAVLARHSLLRHSVAPAGDGLDVDDGPAFREGVLASGEAPLSRLLFRVRARQLLSGTPPAENRAYLSGLLIGAEVHALLDEAPRGCPVLLCAARRHTGLYTAAFTVLDAAQRLTAVPPAVMDLAVPRAHLAILG